MDDNMASEDESDKNTLRNGEESEQELSTHIDNGRDPSPSANTNKRQEREKMVNQHIDEVLTQGRYILELNDMGIIAIPEVALELKHVQYVYLAGNKLTVLPDNFFECMSNMVWLDLRRNYLASIPSAYISRHRCLRTLLLEGNALRNLPLELGLVSTLTGLNIANNPLEFPPEDIIQKGTQTILSFFREMLSAKSEGRVFKAASMRDLGSQQKEDEVDAEWGTRSRNGGRSAVRRVHSQDGSRSVAGNELVGPVPQSVSLHTPSSYNDMRHLPMNRLRRHANNQQQQAKQAAIKKQQQQQQRGRKKQADMQRQYEEPPPQEMVEQRYLEERKTARLQELKSKQNQLLQRRKDYALLKAFREDSRQLQQWKELEKRNNRGQLDYDKAAENAPFGVNAADMHMATNEERIAANVREKHEQLRQQSRAISPESVLRLEDVRRERDRQLEMRIREHTANMQERKRKPKGNPQEEMHAAMEELKIAEQLQLEIAVRRKDLEYRFTAFTGNVSSARSLKHIKVKPPLAPIMPGR